MNFEWHLIFLVEILEENLLNSYISLLAAWIFLDANLYGFDDFFLAPTFILLKKSF